jgi:hypothetical protein
MTHLHFVGYLRQVTLALVRCDDVAGQGLLGYPLRRLHAYCREFNSSYRHEVSKESTVTGTRDNDGKEQLAEQSSDQ